MFEREQEAFLATLAIDRIAMRLRRLLAAESSPELIMWAERFARIFHEDAEVDSDGAAWCPPPIEAVRELAQWIVLGEKPKDSGV